MEKAVFSGRSGRKIAKIELLDAVNPIETGDRYSFRVLKGFGFMWRKSFNEETMTVKKGETEFLIYLVAFPSEKGNVGILDIGITLPPRSEEATQSAQQQSSSSFFERVRGYLTQPTERVKK